MKPQIVLLALIGVLVGCSTAPTNFNHAPTPSQLVDPYTFEMEKERPFEPPYVAKFSAGDKKLIYLAAKHAATEKYADLLKHPTFLSIKKVFAETPVDAVIVEGIAPWVGSLPSTFSIMAMIARPPDIK